MLLFVIILLGASPYITCFRGNFIGYKGISKNESSVATSPSNTLHLCGDSGDVGLLESCADFSLDPDVRQRGHVSVNDLIEFFSASSQDVRRFLRAIGWVGLEQISCSKLCAASVQFAFESFGLPRQLLRPGYYCAKWVCGDAGKRCTQWVPVSAGAMEQFAKQVDLAEEDNKKEGNADVIQLETTRRNETPTAFLTVLQGRRGSKEGEGASDAETGGTSMLEESQSMSEQQAQPLRYSTGDLALRVAHMFNVFPASINMEAECDFAQDMKGPDSNFSSLLQRTFSPKYGDLVPINERTEWNKIQIESNQWVGTAVRKLAYNSNAVRAWFGNSDAKTMLQVRNILNRMVQTLSHLKVAKGVDQYCNPNSPTVAYVNQYWHHNGQFDRGEMERGRYVIRVCPRFWEHQLFRHPVVKFGTLVHESAHHHGPTDVEYNGARSYARAQCLRLASERQAEALGNADNYKWLTYYIIRCNGKQQSTWSRLTSPCELSLTVALSWSEWIFVTNDEVVRVDVRLRCQVDVEGVTLRLEKDGQAYNRSEMTSVSKDSTIPLGTYPMWRGTTVGVVFEVDQCTIWEAVATWEGMEGSEKRFAAKHLVDFLNPSLETLPAQREHLPSLSTDQPIDKDAGSLFGDLWQRWLYPRNRKETYQVAVVVFVSSILFSGAVALCLCALCGKIRGQHLDKKSQETETESGREAYPTETSGDVLPTGGGGYDVHLGNLPDGWHGALSPDNSPSNRRLQNGYNQ